MRERDLIRNIKRIPRLQFHIKRLPKKGASEERIQGFKDELARRKKDMVYHNHEDLLKTLLGVKLSHFADEESERLLVILAEHTPEPEAAPATE